MERSEYWVDFTDEAKKQLYKLDESVQKKLHKIQKEKIEKDPIHFGKPLQHGWNGHRRIRFEDYRVIYRIEGKKITIVAIAHRKQVY